MLSKKLVLPAAMLAIVLVVAVPAAAQVNTGNVVNEQGITSHGSTSGDVATGGSGVVDPDVEGGVSDVKALKEKACHDRITDILKSEFGIATDAKDDKLVNKLCDN